MTVIAPACWLVFWLFPVFSPLGILLLYIFGQNQSWFIIVGAGWLYYTLLTIWGLRAKHRRAFFVVFIILCVSLLLNCAGCNSIFHLNLRC